MYYLNFFYPSQIIAEPYVKILNQIVNFQPMYA